jgi:hypothetical protein
MELPWLFAYDLSQLCNFRRMAPTFALLWRLPTLAFNRRAALKKTDEHCAASNERLLQCAK